MNEEDELYKENILDHYKNPHNKKKIEHATHTHKEFNPSCGDEITLFLKVQNHIITDVGFEGTGCAISQASVSMLTEYIKGKSVEEIKKIKEEKILELLGISIGPSRLKCALLSLKTLQNSLEEGNET
jgi:nitrogen fixation protein NifU and related proteins